MMSYARTALLMAAMTALFLVFGLMLGGQTGMIIAFVIAAGMNMFAYWNADKMVLSMYGARHVSEHDAPELYGIVRRLARRADLPMPKVYIIDNNQPNAFATGRNPENAAVAATTGLLRTLSHDEVSGVMAHELAHVKNRDTLIMTITATIAGAISMLANFALFFGGNRNNPLGIIGTILMMILAPMAAMLVQMAISRTREFAADKEGAAISGQPLALASALARLHQGATLNVNEPAERSPATAHLFIVNPLKGGSIDSLFSTHPRMEDRISRLEAMAATGSYTPVNRAATRRSATTSVPTTEPGEKESPRSSPKGPWG